jgi:anti-anti-sigma factor
MTDERRDPHFRTERIRNYYVIRISGEIDLSVAPRLRELIGETPPACSLVTDLSQCTYLDSTVLAALIQAHIARRGDIVVVVPSDVQIRRVFEITNLDKVLKITPHFDQIE